MIYECAMPPLIQHRPMGRRVGQVVGCSNGLPRDGAPFAILNSSMSAICEIAEIFLIDLECASEGLPLSVFYFIFRFHAPKNVERCTL